MSKRKFRASCLHDRIAAAGVDLGALEKRMASEGFGYETDETTTLITALCNAVMHDYLLVVIRPLNDTQGIIEMAQKADAVKDVLAGYPACYGAVRLVWERKYLREMLSKFTPNEAARLRKAIEL